MRLGIMQPYFLPYLGYFSLIKHTDRFILFDTVQFIRHGWIERNRILKPMEGWQYIQVPLIKHSQTTAIQEIEINNQQDWGNKILAQLQHYKKKAPFYFPTIKLLTEVFSQDFATIGSLNLATLRKISEYLGIDTEIEVFSEMNLPIEEANEADEWALNICKELDGVDEYWNPIGGLSFFNREKYESAGINIQFQDFKISEYDQKRDLFEGGLSIIDVMMFNSPEDINKMLDGYELL